MIDTQLEIFTYLSGVTAVTSLLDNSLGIPAIFTSVMPEGVILGEKCAVIVDIANSDENEDTFDSEHRRASTLIRIYCKPRGSEANLVNTAEAVRRALKDWSKTVSVAGPQAAPTESPDERGRLIILETLIEDI